MEKATARISRPSCSTSVASGSRNDRGLAAADLSGYCLTDNTNQWNKSRIPDGTVIEAGARPLRSRAVASMNRRSRRK